MLAPFETLFRSYLSSDLAQKKIILTQIFSEDKSGEYREVITEGLRTNISELFAFIAFETNYPALFFTDREFNQMVLKAIFLDLDIKQIKDLNKRRNTELDEMIQDYKEERELAFRPVPMAVSDYFS